MAEYTPPQCEDIRTSFDHPDPEYRNFPGTKLAGNSPIHFERFLFALLFRTDGFSARSWCSQVYRGDWYHYFRELGALPDPSPEYRVDPEHSDPPLLPGCYLDNLRYIRVGNLQALYEFWGRIGAMTKGAELMFLRATAELSDAG